MQDIPELQQLRQAAEQSPEYAAELAKTMNEQAFGLYLSGSLRNSALQSFPHQSCKLYFDELIQTVFPGVELGAVDPLLRMRIEQVVMLHHNIGVLFTEGTSGHSIDERKVVLGLATQLLAEFRRLSGAVRMELAELETFRPVVPARPVSSSEQGNKKANRVESREVA